jgi:hypothetical protein
MHHDVGAERKRPRQHRRRRGRIDGEKRARRVRGFGSSGDIGDRPERVRGRFDPDELRLARANRGAQRR